MKAILKAILVGSVAMLAVPQASNAFSLSSVLGGHDDRPAPTETVGGDGVAGSPVLMAQAANQTVEVQQLQEAVRKLTGRVEDLNFQLLQMQEQMRQMQKDNEFRFQRLEGGAAGAGTAPASSDHTQEMTAAPPSSRQAGGALPGVATGTTGSTTLSANDAGSDLGTPPRPLGTMTFDSDGAMVGGTMAPPGSNASGTRTASLPSSASPQDIYRHAYNQLLHGNYKAAENGFHDYIDIFPDGPEAASAAYWLGESEFSQGKFNEAAKTFLDAHQKYPKAKKAPETLLKLGMALAALDNHDTACATYREVLKRYPNASSEVRKKVADEEQRAGC